MNDEQAKLVLDKMLTICLQNCKWRMQNCGLIDQRVIGLCGTPAKPEKIDFRYIEFNGNEGKAALVAHLQGRFRAEQAWGYLLAFETRLFEGQGQNQKRHEAIVVAAIMRGYHRGVAAIFERKPGLTERIVFTKDVPIESEEPLLGLFATLLD